MTDLENVKRPDGKECPAYVAKPSGSARAGIVVIQEWWGLNDQIKKTADRLANEGYLAIVPDLYRGKLATNVDEANHSMANLDFLDATQQDIRGCVQHLSAAGASKVAITGFCMGGGLTWHAAAKLAHVVATAPFYGGGPEMTDEEVAQIKGPVLAIFGELDQGVSPEVANKRAAQMDKAGVQHETIIYPNAQHAFFNDTRAAYNPEAAADAWQRVIALFKETLVNE